ncbi:AAA family ATPase [Candidatus Woesearchaeota archaeon]|nr:AAA family ATPase [Candidatus Woesearchaeota archaeon]
MRETKTEKYIKDLRNTMVKVFGRNKRFFQGWFEKMEPMTFASVLKNPIYNKRDVLYSLEPPTGFLHRTGQKNELIMELAPILMGSAVSCVFVYGVPGTGKTGLIFDLMKELEQEADNKEVELKTAYINCSENRTETVILIGLLNQLNPEREYPRMGWTRAKALSEFNNLLEDESKQVLVILDEVDYVLKESGDDILYRLSRINNSVKSKVSTLVISNDVRVGDYIKPRTQSAFGRVKVIFSPYTSDELFDILKERAKVAFKPGVITDAVIKKVAEIEAQRNGDARKALELMDSCAKIAIAKKRNKITLDLVEEADKNLERDQMLAIVQTLTQHQKLIYLSILKNEEKVMAGSDIYRIYLEECESLNIKPLSERRVRSFLIELTEMGLIESEVGWLASAKKKTRKISLNLDKAVKNKAIKLIRDSI